ncbi:transcriptional regulator, Fis domain protein [Bordetella bronchiseptica E014]|nr:transcriptional regulator, Fis domain protein [Bordetella bronchiseptica OSU054]KCV41871.1 transcriptional regulator, Fis domain protein [Bordetella bronchiseptica 345]KCV57538.1 transcriptional regulator, Fis domain protein [Bordetella bronchiseptica 7E71]KDC19482.1 transcriptional regulator, Fis domain protein [Bordetella bronchiseptica F-1]KDC20453.1 transcriptional regulator, Fis domain protein [Bordetella bronchiseptica E014]KDC34537.1 transcriptional regulator, Fis domain protein [Bor
MASFIVNEAHAMRALLECAVLVMPDQPSWVGAWLAAVRGPEARLADRLRLHEYPLSGGRDGLALGQAAMSLRRFDALLLPVQASTLGWARLVLAQASPALSTPVLVLVRDLTAPAIADLLRLGARDFLRVPACLEELRVRASRAWRAIPPPAAGARAAVPVPGAEPGGGPGPGAPADPGEGGGYRLPGMPETADASAAAPCMLAQTRAPYAATLGDARMAVQRELPFRQAKAQVVGRFERAYLRGALARHGGNVAQAARAACKHRRAFWALMRKHGIDARPYREGVAGAWPYETAPPRDPADEA